MVPACASGGSSIDGFGIRLRVRGSRVSMKPVSRKSPLPAMRQDTPMVGSAKEKVTLQPPLWREKLAIGALVVSSFGKRGTETGGNAATFCGGGSAGRDAAAAAASLAAPLRKTSSTIWSK